WSPAPRRRANVSLQGEPEALADEPPPGTLRVAPDLEPVVRLIEETLGKDATRFHTPSPPGRLRAGLRIESIRNALKPWKTRLEFRESGRRKCHAGKRLYFDPPSSSTEWGSGGRWFESSRPDI